MNTSRNRYPTNDTGDSQEPRRDGSTSLGFYRDTPSTSADPRPYIPALDTAFENDIGSAASHTSGSQSPSEYHTPGGGLRITRTNTGEEKKNKFSKFKFSLTAPPPKPKPKQPGPTVRVGGRGGAGNIKRIKSATTVLPGGFHNQERKTVPISVENSRAHQPTPEGEPTSHEHGEIGVPRLKTGRGGAGNLYNQVGESGGSERVNAHEDALIRQRREMQSEQVAHRTGRGGAGHIKRSDDDTDREYSTSGSSGPRDFEGRGRVTGKTNGFGATSSSGMGADIQTYIPDIPAHPNFNYRSYAPPPGEKTGPFPPILKQEDTDVLVARGYDAHVGRAGSSRRTNGVYPIPHRAPRGDIRSGEPSGRPRPGAMPLPRLVIPQDPPLPSHPSGDNGRRRRPVANPDAMVGSRPQDLSPLNGHPDHEPDRHAYFHGSRMSPLRETLLPSHPRSPQRTLRAPLLPSPQRGLAPHQFGAPDSPEDGPAHRRAAHYSYQTTLTSPTIVSPPTPSTVFEENPPGGFTGWIKGIKLPDTNESHLESDFKRPGIDRVRHSGPDKDQSVGPEVISKPQEEGRDTMYSDLFDGRGITSLELESINSQRDGTPFSDRSSILVPRGTSSDVLSSTARKVQNRPANPQPADIPTVLSTRPTSRRRSQSEEESLHCDELNAPPHKALSRMEKAILRRTEFGQNIDLSRVQLS